MRSVIHIAPIVLAQGALIGLGPLIGDMRIGPVGVTGAAVGGLTWLAYLLGKSRSEEA